MGERGLFEDVRDRYHFGVDVKDGQQFLISFGCLRGMAISDQLKDFRNALSALQNGRFPPLFVQPFRSLLVVLGEVLVDVQRVAVNGLPSLPLFARQISLDVVSGLQK